jgi:hypothetical protein
MRPEKLAVFIGLLGVTACGTMPLRKYFNDNGIDRAAFEMKCPREQLQLVPLNKPLDQTAMYGDTVGVIGCGQRAVYLLTQSGWLLNSLDGEATGKKADEAPKAAEPTK